MTLPELIDFDESGHPELIDIFRGIDVGISALIASDPTLKRREPVRRNRGTSATKGNKHHAATSRRRAA